MSDERTDMDRILDDLYPYRRTTTTYRRIPEQPADRAEILAAVADMAHREDAQGDAGRVSGSLYSGDHEHYRFLGDVFTQFAHANVLQRDMYPSATKFEAEIVAMVLALLHGDDPVVPACGVLTGGGSESLITALYSYREQAREVRGIRAPNIVMPVTAHVALDKGAHWLGIDVRKVALTDDFTVDVHAMEGLIDEDTIAIIGSAGDYGHGLIDPIPQLGELAQSRGIGLHVDGCLGGLMLPWAERLGYDVPRWDFRVPGVTTISADTHKYGYALKGTSTLLYRDRDLRAHQWFSVTDWPGGLYLSPGFQGSRSGGLIASTWAAMVTIGEPGYLSRAEAILRANDTIKQGIRERIPQLQVIGDPLFMTSFRSDEVDVYLVNDVLKERGWRMNSLQLPAALHFCITGPNATPGIAEDFLDDLQAAVDHAIDHAGTAASSGAMYGFSGTSEGAAMLTAAMGGVLDAMYAVAPEST